MALRSYGYILYTMEPARHGQPRLCDPSTWHSDSAYMQPPSPHQTAANASDCCRRCSESTACHYWSFNSNPGPLHNQCWLQQTGAGLSPQRGTTCGACGDTNMTLRAPGLADRGLVYVGSALQGEMGSWVPVFEMDLRSAPAPGHPLRILVSNEGRQSGELISLARNQKGILGFRPQAAVTLAGSPLRAFDVTHLPLPDGL